MSVHRIRISHLVAVAALVAACNEDPTKAQLSGAMDTDNSGTADDDGTVADGTSTGATTQTSAMSASQGDGSGSTGTDPDSSTGTPSDDTTSTGAAESSTSSGDTDTDTDTDTDGDTEGGVPCLGDGDCDDGLHCNGVETCVAGFCAAGVDPECDDGVACTTDACDEMSDACVSIADDSACSDGLHCNGAETCDPFAGCQAGTDVVCNDGIDCTTDACDEDANACAFTPDPAPCQDDSFCNGAEVCAPGMGCQAAAQPMDCNDLVGCTVDSCDDVAGACVHAPNDATCDNGVYCDGAETCMPGLGCIDAPNVDCPDDGIDCTVELCDEANNTCSANLDNMICTAQGLQFCTAGGCVSGQQCEVDGDCDDGLACNGAETCDCAAPPCEVPGNPGVCQAGPPETCFDGVACTSDACVELGGGNSECVYTADDSACGDSNPCNGTETCDEVLGCQAGAAPNCSDGIDCTDDFCLPAFGCFSSGDDAQCNDGVFCNGQEVCSPGIGCEPQAFACPDDGVACTTEICDEAFGGCRVIADDTMCDCGLHCDPAAPDIDAMGCTDQCSPAVCDGTIWQCGNCLDDDGDCSVDDEDPDCFGVCDNNEAGFAGLIPGQNSAPCKMDCYFDDDSGSGNDNCNWSHNCDPLNPQPASCDCEPDPGQMLCDANIPGYSGTCDDAWASQSQLCLDICGPVTPNGCDCFGCCEVSLDNGTQTTIYLGSEEPGGDPSCHAGVLDDPILCKPCTQVQACLNTCDPCELCFGETELPPECGGVPECTGENPQPCGLPSLPDCPSGQFCLTGCCSSF